MNSNVVTKEVFSKLLNSEMFVYDELHKLFSPEEREKYGYDVLKVKDGLAMKTSNLNEMMFNQLFGNMGGELLSEIDKLEDFYGETKFGIRLISHKESLGLIKELEERNYRIGGFSNLSVIELPSYNLQGAYKDHIYKIKEVTENNIDQFSETLVEGFGAKGLFAEMLTSMAKAMLKHDKSKHYLCYEGDIPVGTGSLIIDSRIGHLVNGAVPPAFRGRRIQQMLIDHRLLVAQERGCRFVQSWNTGYNTSFRNLERNGFRLAFNNVFMVK